VAERNGIAEKVRKYRWYSALGPTRGFGVYNASVDALMQAFEERSFLCEVDGRFLRTPRVQSRAYEMDPHLQRFRARVVGLVKDVATIITLRDVVQEYHGAKRRVYEKARQSLMRDMLTRMDAELKFFGKFEKTSLNKANRIISPRSARYNLVLGKYLKKAEKLYFHAINKAMNGQTEHTVIKGMNVVETASALRDKWNQFKDPVGVSLDARKYDAHIGVEALRWEHGFYTGVFDSSDELRRILGWQLKNKGVGYCRDGKVHARFPGKRCSGDLNTSLGNTIIMCGLVDSLVRSLQITSELADNGDDCIVMMERENVERFVSAVPGHFAKYGFRMTVEPTVDVFERIEFCQSHPVFDGEVYRMVRNPLTCMTKDPMCLFSFSTERPLRKWRWAVGSCGRALVPGIPVMDSFYNCMTRGGLECRKSFTTTIFRNTSMEERSSGLDAVHRAITACARCSFAVAFGIDPSMQVALERYYDGLVLSDKIVENWAAGPPMIELAPLISRYD
jgi:hypothetical protein